jgi:hypothetical protein
VALPIFLIKNFKNMKKLCIFAFLIIGFQNIQAQTEKELITKTLMDYIEGSTGGQPERLKTAFHPDLNLYYIKNGNVAVWAGTAYIADTKEGQPTGESGKILSIDYENNAGVAKVEISSPDSSTPYIDYFMLLKERGKWIIIHKMFTKKTSK